MGNMINPGFFHVHHALFSMPHMLNKNPFWENSRTTDILVRVWWGCWSMILTSMPCVCPQQQARHPRQQFATGCLAGSSKGLPFAYMGLLCLALSCFSAFFGRFADPLNQIRLKVWTIFCRETILVLEYLSIRHFQSTKLVLLRRLWPTW